LVLWLCSWDLVMIFEDYVIKADSRCSSCSTNFVRLLSICELVSTYLFLLDLNSIGPEGPRALVISCDYCD
jgi:hypothetical protein